MSFPILNWLKRNMPQLIRFGVVGTISAAINLSVYYIASEVLGFGVNFSSIFAFCVSIINNYIMNHRWTFGIENDGNPINIKQFFHYVMGNIQGLLINLAVLNLVVYLAGIEFHLLGQLLGILSGMVSNFIFAKKMVFVNKRRI